ncbi:MAG: acyltransferase [Chitinophagales bacterium]
MINQRYFHNLDAIRFIAAMMVFLQHDVSPAYQYLPCQNSFALRVLQTLSSGATGVSVFFVLSGFLITYLLITEQQRNGAINVPKFYMRRVLRIWPLYFAVLLFAFGVYPFLKQLLGVYHELIPRPLYYFTFLSNFDVIRTITYFHGQDTLMQNTTWSVAVEEQFYLFWPLLFAFLPRRLWLFAISAVIAGSVGFRIWHRYDNTILFFHTFSVLADLGIGGLLALLIIEYPSIKQFFETASTRTHFLLLLLALMLNIWRAEIFAFPLGLAVGRVIIALSFGLIIAAQAITTQESVFNLQRFSFADKWGKYTYGIYLLHPIALLIVDVAARTLHLPTANLPGGLIAGGCCFILTLLLSKWSYNHFESRFLALKGKFS